MTFGIVGIGTNHLLLAYVMLEQTEMAA